MTALSQVKRSVLPARHVILSPGAFADDWSGKPPVQVAIGLRLLSVLELAECRLEAEREAAGVYNEHSEDAPPIADVIIEQYNEILLCEAAARCTCNPNDITKPYFDNASATVRVALTSEGLRKVWDEYLLFSVGCGAVTTPASDDDVKTLARGLRNEMVRAVLDVEDRKLCAYLLEKLSAALPDREERDQDDEETAAVDEDEESVHIALTE